MSGRHTVLRLEELGGRVLPSTTMAAVSTGATAQVRADDGTPSVSPGGPEIHASGHTDELHTLHGVGGGDYITGVKTSEGGTESRLYGEMYLVGVGQVSVTGTVWTVGTAAGEGGGTITLRNDKGSITLALEGPEQAASSKLPKNFHFEVIEGTGAYANFRETGQIHLNLDSSHALGGGKDGGDFTLTIGEHKDAHHAK
jgi:hypothetical protein